MDSSLGYPSWLLEQEEEVDWDRFGYDEEGEEFELVNIEVEWPAGQPGCGHCTSCCTPVTFFPLFGRQVLLSCDWDVEMGWAQCLVTTPRTR